MDKSKSLQLGDSAIKMCRNPQGGPLLVISKVITPINGLIQMYITAWGYNPSFLGL